MKYNDMLKIIQELEFDQKKVLCTDGNVQLFVIRPSKLPKKLKNAYDVKKNFQIWLKEGERNFEPKTLFFQGWIREFIDSPKEIDNLCMSVCNGQPPKVQYTDKENKKNKKYDENHKSLWYFNQE